MSKVAKLTFTFYIDDPVIVNAIERNEEEMTSEEIDQKIIEMCHEELAQWEDDPLSHADFEIINNRGM